MDTGLDHTYMDFKLTSDRDFCLLYPVPNAAHEYFWGGRIRLETELPTYHLIQKNQTLVVLSSKKKCD